MRAAEFSDNLIRGISLHCNDQQLPAHIATQEIVRWTIKCGTIHKATFRHEKSKYSPNVARLPAYPAKEAFKAFPTTGNHFFNRKR
jgi:hypothetical protein